MKICTQTDALGHVFTPEECVSILADAGWDAIDWSFFQMTEPKSVWLEPDWRSRAEKVRALADERGLKIAQAHAPFPSGTGKSERDREIFDLLIRSMEVASILGVENIVVHPLKWIDVLTHSEEAWRINLELYRRLIPHCERLNITVCAENMKTYNKETQRFDVSFCGNPELFCGLIDRLGSPYIRACLDVGHSALAGIEPDEFIRALGAERLNAVHIHDVDYIDDRHNLPFQENLEWEPICRALGEIGYRGWFTLESDNFMKRMPPALWPDAEVFMVKTARYLAGRVEFYAAHKGEEN